MIAVTPLLIRYVGGHNSLVSRPQANVVGCICCVGRYIAIAGDRIDDPSQCIVKVKRHIVPSPASLTFF